MTLRMNPDRRIFFHRRIGQSGLMALILVLPFSARGQGQAPWWRAAKIAAGMAAGYAVHEAGHLTAAGMEGKDVHFQGGLGGSIEVSAEGEAAQRIAMSGLMAQGIASQAVLLHEDWRESDMGLGILFFHLTNSVFYIVRHEVTSGGYGDLKFYEEQGGSKSLAYGLILGHAVLTVAQYLYHRYTARPSAPEIPIQERKPDLISGSRRMEPVIFAEGRGGGLGLSLSF